MNEDGLLLQQVHGGDDTWTPWRVVVVSLLCQRTTGDQVRLVVTHLFERWPVPSSLSLATPELESLLRPTGFQNQRANRMRVVSAEYDDWFLNEREPGTSGRDGPPPLLVATWPGCGEYVVDAYKMIVRGDNSFEPKDKELRKLWQSRTSPASS